MSDNLPVEQVVSECDGGTEWKRGGRAEGQAAD